MRIRTIKPEFWTNEKLSAVHAETALLAVALLNYSDDEGYFNANPRLNQAALFPLRELSRKLPVMLQELSNIGFICLKKSTDSRAYGVVTRFLDHQAISHPKKSTIRPLYEDCSDPSCNITGSVHEASIKTLSGMEGNREQGTGNGREQGTGSGRRKPAGNVVGVLPDEQPESIRRRMLLINDCKHRLHSTRWSGKEFEAFKAAGLDRCTDEEFSEQAEPVRAYYAAELSALRMHWGKNGSQPDSDYRRRDLLTLLNNWPGEVDRAQAWQEFQSKQDLERGSGRL